MKANLLKRWRKEAYDKYGISFFINTDGHKVWVVGPRDNYHRCYASKNCTFEHSEADAKRVLERIRREDIIARLRAIRPIEVLSEEELYNRKVQML